MQGQCSSQAQMKQPKQSRSSVGQSATLIMQRSPVQIWTGLLSKRKFLNYCNHYRWGVSSAGQSTCLARRGSSVRLRYPPLFSLKEEQSSGDQDKGVMIVRKDVADRQRKRGSSPYTSQQYFGFWNLGSGISKEKFFDILGKQLVLKGSNTWKNKQ